MSKKIKIVLTGGGTAGHVCNMDWKCGEWSDCINGLQTRQCDFVKVPQHVQDTQCPDSSKSPPTSQTCEVKPLTPITALVVSNETKEAATTTIIETPSNLTTEPLTNRTGLSAISGAVISVLTNPKSVRELIIGVVVIVLVVSGFIGYKFMYKRK